MRNEEHGGKWRNELGNFPSALAMTRAERNDPLTISQLTIN